MFVLSGFWNMSNSKWETLHDHAPLLKRCWFTTVVVLNAENNQVSDRCTRFPMANVCLKQASCARWFKVTFSSPSWGSLSHLKGSLNHPKRVTENCVCVCQKIEFTLKSWNTTCFYQKFHGQHAHVVFLEPNWVNPTLMAFEGRNL